ncbi:MAG: YceI family protein [Candidatus Moraniibacteriota bacterium]
MNKNIIYFALLLIFVGLVSYSLVNLSPSSKNTTPTNSNSAPTTPIEPVENKDSLSFKINPATSTISWAAKKTLVNTNNHLGTVKIKDGFLSVHENTLTGGEITIDMQSITSTDLMGAFRKKLEDHLKSADFFAANEFPTAQLIIKQVGRTENSQTLVIGDLTIKDNTNEVEFVANIENITEKEIKLKADLSIDRTLWDIRYGSGKFFDNLGDAAIDDLINLSLEIKAQK